MMGRPLVESKRWFSAQDVRRSNTGDKTLTAVHTEHVLLPKKLTDSFYVTMMRCYEEIFNATLTSKLTMAMKACADGNTTRKLLLTDQFKRLTTSDLSDENIGLIGTYTPRSHSFSVLQANQFNSIERVKQSNNSQFRTCAKSFSSARRSPVRSPEIKTDYRERNMAAGQIGGSPVVYKFKNNKRSKGPSYEINIKKSHEITSL